MTEKCKLLANDVALLNAFLGNGDFENADIVVMMNEGGLGGRIDSISKKENYEIQIGCRVEAFGTDKRYYLNPDNKLDGYWELGGISTELKVKEYYKSRGYSFEHDAPVNAPSLQFMSRMVQSLESDQKSWYRWFANNTDDSETYMQIKNFIRDGGILCERTGIKTALVDWRPLPRFNQEEHSGKKGTGWPFEGGVDEKQYSNAFAFINEKKLDEFHRGLRNQRIAYLRKLFARTKAPVMIFAGDKKLKLERLLPEILSYNGKEPEFTEGTINNTDKIIYRAKIDYGNRTAHVFVTDFFDNRNGIGIEGLKNLTAEIYEILRGVKVTAPSSEIMKKPVPWSSKKEVEGAVDTSDGVEMKSINKKNELINLLQKYVDSNYCLDIAKFRKENRKEYSLLPHYFGSVKKAVEAVGCASTITNTQQGLTLRDQLAYDMLKILRDNQTDAKIAERYGVTKVAISQLLKSLDGKIVNNEPCSIQGEEQMIFQADALVQPGARGVTNSQMIPVLKKATDDNDIVKILLLAEQYSDVFGSSTKYIGVKRQEKLKELLDDNCVGVAPVAKASDPYPIK